MIRQVFINKSLLYLIVTLIFIFFLSFNSSGQTKIITLRSYGAKGDGRTDDTKAFVNALKATQYLKVILSGENLSYYIRGEQTLSLIKLVLKNLTIRLGSSHNGQLNFNLNCNDISMDNVKIVGSRGEQIEDWKVFSLENNVKSIMPEVADVFLINALNKEAKILINNFEASNIHARSCITIRTFGSVDLTNVKFKNISNKTIHVYHTTDDGKTVAGSTHLRYGYASGIGILPKKIRVNGALVETSLGKYMPQESFNFIVSFGRFYANNVTVTNYGSIGLTADRNEYFEADSININNSSDQTFSNNSSAALWFEACKSVHLKSVNIAITKRGLNELKFDNSAIHIYGSNSLVLIDNLKITGGTMTVLNKGIRGSLEGENTIKLGNVSIQGKYKDAGISFGILDEKNLSSISIGNLNLVNNKADFYGINNVHIGTINGSTKNEEVNFYVYNNSVGQEKISIDKTNISNFGLNKNIKNFSVRQNLSNKKINIKIIN